MLLPLHPRRVSIAKLNRHTLSSAFDKKTHQLLGFGFSGGSAAVAVFFAIASFPSRRLRANVWNLSLKPRTLLAIPCARSWPRGLRKLSVCNKQERNELSETCTSRVLGWFTGVQIDVSTSQFTYGYPYKSILNRRAICFGLPGGLGFQLGCSSPTPELEVFLLVFRRVRLRWERCRASSDSVVGVRRPVARAALRLENRSPEFPRWRLS